VSTVITPKVSYLSLNTDISNSYKQKISVREKDDKTSENDSDDEKSVAKCSVSASSGQNQKKPNHNRKKVLENDRQSL
jgi:hypothetical protein